ncbi:MAG: hypothetical protein M3Z28_13835 [Candidatus Dormibacteraeota bacterium]|nr:hypothetical protein [Candidatus Dormibacteraeota bacterium]
MTPAIWSRLVLCSGHRTGSFGACILNVDPERPRALKEQDPAVRAGRFSVQICPWIVPAGAMTFGRARLPRSMAETET